MHERRLHAGTDRLSRMEQKFPIRRMDGDGLEERRERNVWLRHHVGLISRVQATRLALGRVWASSRRGRGPIGAPPEWHMVQTNSAASSFLSLNLPYFTHKRYIDISILRLHR